jgi:predicted anti-sigma-YlaC factor YlaD
MNQTSCHQESATARAVRSGEWDEELLAHLSQCATCRGVQQAAQWMQALADSSQHVPAQNDLPDPQILWLRAQLSERQAAAERAHRILQWIELACAMVTCIGLGVWFAWNWSEVGSATGNGLNWVLFEAWPALWNAYGPVNAPVLFSSALAVISLAAVAIAYPLVARD